MKKIEIYLRDLHKCQLCLDHLKHMGVPTTRLEPGRYVITHLCDDYDVVYTLDITEKEVEEQINTKRYH